MTFRSFAKPAACLVASSALLFGGAAFATPASPLCGGKKGVQKPKDDDEKKPANPASIEALCGGGKKGVQKPKDDDEKKPANPA